MQVPSPTKLILLCVILILFSSLNLAPSVQGQSQQPAESPQATALPVPLSGISDEGVFHMYVNEDHVGTITFKWQTDGTFDNKLTLSMAGQSVTTTVKIVPDKDGRWASILMEAPQGPITVVREGNTAKRTFKEKVETVNLKPGAVTFDNSSPALWALPVRFYDTAKGGKQTFPLFIIPGVMMEGSLEMKDTVERDIGGKDIEFTRFVYGLPGVDVTLWIGVDGKLYLADVPAQHAVIVREGYEALRKVPESDPLLSAPRTRSRRNATLVFRCVMASSSQRTFTALMLKEGFPSSSCALRTRRRWWNYKLATMHGAAMCSPCRIAGAASVRPESGNPSSTNRTMATTPLNGWPCNHGPQERSA